MAPVLLADRVRIDGGGEVAVDGLQCTAAGPRVVVLGASPALFAAAAGLAPVVHGALRVAGEDPRQAVAQGSLAGAALDPPLPPRMALDAYVAWSAALAGLSPFDARHAAEAAITAMALGDHRRALLGPAPLVLKRAAVLTAALATAAPTIVLQDPTPGLDEAIVPSFVATVARALEDRAWVLFAGRMGVGAPLMAAANEAVVLAGDEVVAQGAPAALATRDRTYALRVRGAIAAFRAALEERGVPVEGSAGHLAVTLDGDLSARDLLTLALDAGAVVLDLRPLSRGFA